MEQQIYQRSLQQSRRYNNNEDDDDNDNVFATIRQPKFSFDTTTGVKLAGILDNPLQASLKELNNDMKQYAEMVKVSTIYHKEGLNKANDRLKAFNKDYILDTDLTTDEYAVIRKPNGKIVVAFRGTNPKAKIKSGLGKDLPEPLMWLPIQAGKEEIFDQHKLNPIKNRILSKYRPDQIEQITGYSMGATKAHRLGDILGIDTHLFNPYLGQKFFEQPRTPNTKHQIVRTTEDIASSLRTFKNKKMPRNVKVDSIDPINTVKMTAKKLHSTAKTNLQAFNLLDNHNLEHFTSEGDRSSLMRTLNDQIQNRVNTFEDQTRGLSKNSSEYKRLQEQMIDDLKPTMKLAGQETDIFTSRGKMFNSMRPSSVITALAGITGGAAVDKLIGKIESASGIPIDDHITTAVSGGLGALPQETVAKFLGGKINFARSITGGIGGALAQQATAEATNSLLVNAGMRTDAAEMVSQTIGGGIGGAVTAGGGALARQLAVRLAARGAALVGSEALAVSYGAEIGSVVPGIGTAIGAGIGALVSLGFAIFDTESRRHAPKSFEEHNYLYGIQEVLASGTDPEELLKDISDNIERDRLREFINESGYQSALEDIRIRRGQEQLQRETYGATLGEIQSLNATIRQEIPNFESMTNKERNEAFQALVSDPRNRNYISQFSTLPEWDENIEDNHGLINTFIYKPRATVVYKGARARAQREYINSPEYISRQEHLTWLTDKLDNDPEFVNARTAGDANIRIFELLNELSNAGGIDGQNAEDFITGASYSHLIPQFDQTGDMILQNYRDGIVQSDYIPPPEPVPERLYQDILTARSGDRGIVAKFINRDQEIQQLVASGDIDGINERIRSIFVERGNVKAFGETVSYDDPELPQFKEDGSLVYQKISEPKPTDHQTPNQVPEPQAPEPEPQAPEPEPQAPAPKLIKS